MLTPLSAGAQGYAGPAYVTRVVDAVTIYADVAGRIETVRYLGIRVPRIEDPKYGNGPYALVSREGNRRLVEGRWIWLLFDGQARDSQGRLRAWVWKGDLFVNGALVRDGWAVAAVTEPRLVEYFGALEAERPDGPPWALAKRELARLLHAAAHHRRARHRRGRPRFGRHSRVLGPGTVRAGDHASGRPHQRTDSIRWRSVSAPATSSSGSMGYTPPTPRSTGGRTVK